MGNRCPQTLNHVTILGKHFRLKEADAIFSGDGSQLFEQMGADAQFLVLIFDRKSYLGFITLGKPVVPATAMIFSFFPSLMVATRAKALL